MVAIFKIAVQGYRTTFAGIHYIHNSPVRTGANRASFPTTTADKIANRVRIWHPSSTTDLNQGYHQDVTYVNCRESVCAKLYRDTESSTERE